MKGKDNELDEISFKMDANFGDRKGKKCIPNLAFLKIGSLI